MSVEHAGEALLCIDYLFYFWAFSAIDSLAVLQFDKQACDGGAALRASPGSLVVPVLSINEAKKMSSGKAYFGLI